MRTAPKAEAAKLRETINANDAFSYYRSPRITRFERLFPNGASGIEPRKYGDGTDKHFYVLHFIKQRKPEWFEKEDYDIALQHLNKYRGILRLNFAHYMCNQSNLVGGCSMQRNMIQEKRQFELLQKKWGNGIVKRDVSNKWHSKKVKSFDYNPIIKVPIKGI